MPKPQSLADLLDVADPRPEEQRTELPLEDETESILDITDPADFCRKILETREFRRYIMHGIVLGNIPPALVTRVMDHGWGKAPEKIEHTGKDGKPIEVTEVRRVIVQAQARDTFAQLEAPREKTRKVTH